MRTRVLAIAWAVLLVAPVAGGAIRLKKDSHRKHAPDFVLQDAEGKTVRLSDLAGKVVLLDFWATWCGPCKNSIPWIIELSDKYQSDGLVVIGVSMDEDGWQVVKPFMEALHITYPVVLGNRRVAYLYGEVEALPVAFFVDRDQRVAAIHAGAANRGDVERVVRILLGVR